MNSLDYQWQWPGNVPALGCIQTMQDPSGEFAQPHGSDQGTQGYQPQTWGGGPAYGMSLWSLEKRRPEEEERRKECERRAAEAGVQIWQMEEMGEDEEIKYDDE